MMRSLFRCPLARRRAEGSVSQRGVLRRRTARKKNATELEDLTWHFIGPYSRRISPLTSSNTSGPLWMTTHMLSN